MKVLQSELNTPSNKKLFHYTQSIDVDQRLIQYEFQVQKAWCKALTSISILTENEESQILYTLLSIEKNMLEGTFFWHIEDEDIHMNIERALTECLGELGKKIHLGRSRNDLIATTLRLFLKDQVQDIHSSLSELGRTIIHQSLDWIDCLTPGLTHMQFGQPVRFGHLYSAHAWTFLGDLERLQKTAQSCMHIMPLGSAALAGTHLDMDLEKMAAELGFKNPPQNSYHSVGDRDFILSALNDFAFIATHLSRLCEELMFWSQTSIGVLKISHEWSTGSSIMPNKRNPDVLEICRAQMARVIALSNEGFMIVKSVLPSYGSDFSEFKRTLLLSLKELSHSIELMHQLIKTLEIYPENAESLLQKGHLLATDLAHEYVQRGYSFREAYQKVGQDIKEAELKNQQVHENCSFSLDFLKSVENRKNHGGTSKLKVLLSLEKLQSLY